MCAPVEPLSNWNKSQTVATFHYTPSPSPLSSHCWAEAWHVCHTPGLAFFVFSHFIHFAQKALLQLALYYIEGEVYTIYIYVYVVSLLYNLLKGSAPHLAGTLKSTGEEREPVQNPSKLNWIEVRDDFFCFWLKAEKFCLHFNWTPFQALLQFWQLHHHLSEWKVV